MRLYAIHAPDTAEAFAVLERARAARTGFSLAALVFGPLWLLVRGIWLALAAYAALAALIVLAAREGFLGAGAAVALFALGQLYLAVEGRALALAARRRGGRPLVDVVYAPSALAAEKTYLERALAGGAAPFRRGETGGAADVIGMFPEPGR
jgi:hypothetical protein